MQNNELEERFFSIRRKTAIFSVFFFFFFFYQIKVFHVEFNLLNNMGGKIICEVLQCFLKGVKKVRSAIHHRI